VYQFTAHDLISHECQCGFRRCYRVSSSAVESFIAFPSMCLRLVDKPSRLDELELDGGEKKLTEKKNTFEKVFSEAEEKIALAVREIQRKKRRI
jgi:hypothetical protein